MSMTQTAFDESQHVPNETLVLRDRRLDVGKLADLLHELNNASMAIETYCELIVMRLGFSDPLCHNAVRIRQAIDRTTAIARELLSPGIKLKTPQEPVSTPLARKGSGTLLLVDDNGAIRNVLTELLIMRGYRVVTAGNAEEALEVDRNHSGVIDLLITDMIMPGIDGYRLARKIRKGRPEIKTIFMSGYPGETVDQWGLVDKNTYFVSKPISLDFLIHKIRELLGQSKDSPRRLEDTKTEHGTGR